MWDVIMVIYFVVTAIVVTVCYLLHKAGMLKYAVIALVFMLVLGAIGIVSGHAEETTIVVENYIVESTIADGEICLLITFQYEGQLLSFYWDGVLDTSRILMVELFVGKNSIECIDAYYKGGTK